ncbi:MAG: YdcF family protein [Caulobacteraceae bacterium]|nr:YdcF family protein [Caulobacteraceae bacterium]
MRIAAGVLIALVIFWAVGLLAFASRVDRSTPAADPPAADGVVALTGRSDLRITSAMKLLERGKGRRVLVSGVNPHASRSDMRDVARATRRMYDCCVDLGYQATDTVGNARETAQWVRSHGYHTLILVTSDFHMPRALLELKAAMPDVTVTPYPIPTAELDAKHWWRSRDSIRRMAAEYCKFLIILGRTSLQRLVPARQASEDEPSQSEAPASAPVASGAAA